MKSVITVAVGSDYYKDLAINLYRSFILWNHSNSIQFQIITDDTNYFSPLKPDKLSILQPPTINSFEGFTSKFILYDATLYEENLFVDCDCLIYSDVSFIFEKFSSHNFSAIGSYINKGQFFCDVEAICKQFRLDQLPKFVGSLYYFKKNPEVGESF